MNWLIVFLGGGVGAVSRYGLGIVFKGMSKGFPWATLVANIIACLLIGALFATQVRTMNKSLWLLLAVGFCGGLSTFSAFSLETVELFQQADYRNAVLNIVISVVGCLLCTYGVSRLIA